MRGKSYPCDYFAWTPRKKIAKSVARTLSRAAESSELSLLSLRGGRIRPRRHKARKPFATTLWTSRPRTRRLCRRTIIRALVHGRPGWLGTHNRWTGRLNRNRWTRWLRLWAETVAVAVTVARWRTIARTPIVPVVLAVVERTIAVVVVPIATEDKADNRQRQRLPVAIKRRGFVPQIAGLAAPSYECYGRSSRHI